MDAKHTLGEPRALISRDALLHNVAVTRRFLSPDTKICAILKADAYGHGAAHVVDTLTNFTCDGVEAPAVDAFAVASVDEAAALPETDRPILIFRPVENGFLGRQRSRLEAAIRAGWVLTICSAAAANDVARIAMSAGSRASVQVMIDTGMTRSGAAPADLPRLLETIQAHASLRLVGLCTHFASADEPESLFTVAQLDRFRECTDDWAARLGEHVLRHAANSGGLFFLPSSHMDMVRPGISLYGIDPTGRPSVQRPLRPAMRWTAPLLHLRDVRKGVGVGYGQTWHAERDTRVALVPIGYADGYLRAFSNRAVMMLHGRPAPVIGRVSMDMVTIDVGNIPQAVVGDEVTVLDDDPLSPASVYKLAELADTIPYEIFCRIGPRIHRVAVDVLQPVERT